MLLLKSDHGQPDQRRGLVAARLGQLGEYLARLDEALRPQEALALVQQFAIVGRRRARGLRPAGAPRG
ncbi:MAG TPA: hypothetical protein VMU50_10440 [Polyangia bacterium]|nr:hypothetical protein [Polyangia bacterium]